MDTPKNTPRGILSLPNELLLNIFSLFPTTALLPFAPTCNHFHSLILRILHHRLKIAASLDGHALYCECDPPFRKVTSIKFFCQSLGTPGLQRLIEDFTTETTHVGHGQRISNLYSRFRPVRREPSFAAALKHPAGDIPGSRTYKSDDMPLFDGEWDEDDAVYDTVTVDAHDLFCQLTVTSFLGKRDSKLGYMNSIQEVSEGIIRVWRRWLARYCETKSWTDGDIALVHREGNGKGKGRGNDMAEEFDPRKDPKVLWMNTRNEVVGIKVRVKERKLPRNVGSSLPYENDVELPVSYQVEFEEVFIQTTHLLLKIEEAQSQLSNQAGKSVIFGSYRGQD